MNLPHWVQKDIDMLPAEFTGQIVIVYWTGGVTRMETKTIRTTPKAGEMKRMIWVSSEGLRCGGQIHRRQHSNRCQLSSRQHCVLTPDSDGHRVTDEHARSISVVMQQLAICS